MIKRRAFDGRRQCREGVGKEDYRPETVIERDRDRESKIRGSHLRDSANTKARAVLEKITHDRYKSLALHQMVSVALVPTA